MSTSSETTAPQSPLLPVSLFTILTYLWFTDSSNTMLWSLYDQNGGGLEAWLGASLFPSAVMDTDDTAPTPRLHVWRQLCGNAGRQLGQGVGGGYCSWRQKSPPPAPNPGAWRGSHSRGGRTETRKPPNSDNSSTVNISWHLNWRVEAAASCCLVYLTVSLASPPARVFPCNVPMK